MAIYSTKYKNIADVPDGGIIAIPNDPSNGARALLMLADKGLIELKDKNNINATIADITKILKIILFVNWMQLLFPRQCLI